LPFFASFICSVRLILRFENYEVEKVDDEHFVI